eukprot:3514613-Rhodomonas_salina.1
MHHHNHETSQARLNREMLADAIDEAMRSDRVKPITSALQRATSEDWDTFGFALVCKACEICGLTNWEELRNSEQVMHMLDEAVRGGDYKRVRTLILILKRLTASQLRATHSNDVYGRRLALGKTELAISIKATSFLPQAAANRDILVVKALIEEGSIRVDNTSAGELCCYGQQKVLQSCLMDMLEFFAAHGDVQAIEKLVPIVQTAWPSYNPVLRIEMDQEEMMEYLREESALTAPNNSMIEEDMVIEENISQGFSHPAQGDCPPQLELLRSRDWRGPKAVRKASLQDASAITKTGELVTIELVFKP